MGGGGRGGGGGGGEGGRVKGRREGVEGREGPRDIGRESRGR